MGMCTPLFNAALFTMAKLWKSKDTQVDLG